LSKVNDIHYIQYSKWTHRR